MSLPTHTLQLPERQPQKRLTSGDVVWIITDIYTEQRRYYGNSSLQRWFKAGGIDLTTGKMGYFRFTIDDAAALVRAGITPPPWAQPLPQAIAVKRLAHSRTERGRYRVDITTVNVDPRFLPLGPVLRQFFTREGHEPNFTPGLWRKLVDRAALDKEIEETALAMVGRFSAGDLRNVLGKGAVNVTRVLRRLVRQSRLQPFGKKRGARYEVIPPTTPARTDWVG